MPHTKFSRAFVFTVLAVSLILPATAVARGHWHGGFFGGYYGPYWGPYYPYPYYYPYYGYGGYAPDYYPGPPMGEVHVKSPDSDAQIFINGAFAGRAHDLKSIYLAPGTYDIEQRSNAGVQSQRVYVLTDRKVNVEFSKYGAVPGQNPQLNQQQQTGPQADVPSEEAAPAPNRQAGPR